MQNIEKWEEGKEQYLLNNGFKLVRVNEIEFGIGNAIYADIDNEFTYNWNKLSEEWDDNNFWIFKDNKKVGGVAIEPNYLARFFVEPPYTVDKFSILSELNNALLQWSGQIRIKESMYM